MWMFLGQTADPGPAALSQYSCVCTDKSEYQISESSQPTGKQLTVQRDTFYIFLVFCLFFNPKFFAYVSFSVAKQPHGHFQTSH